jgi:mRNA-degrading endonuclease RelE of RelBE toxin-antitoxin system
MRFKFAVTSRFDRSIRQLKKRYPKVTNDLLPIMASIEATPTVGVVIPNDYQIRKIRVPSSDMQRGKSGGFRLLYKLTERQEADELIATLLYLYAKTDQADLSTTFLEMLSQEISDDE